MNEALLSLLTTYQLPAIFLGSFFFGETVILSAAFLAGQGIWSVETVFWLAFFGTVLSDSIWFIFGQQIFKMTNKWSKYKDKYEIILKKIEKITGNKPFLSLLFIKFLYGTRILTIIYLSIRKTSFWTFTIFNIIGTIIWLIVSIYLGWLAGKGIADVMPIVHNAGYALTALLLLLILAKIVTAWLGKKVISK